MNYSNKSKGKQDTFKYIQKEGNWNKTYYEKKDDIKYCS